MYVIFPLDQLLDIDSADKSKSKKDLKIESGGLKRHSVEVLSPTHPGQKLPGQQPLTSPVCQSPTAASGAQQTPSSQDKAAYRGTPPSSPVKSPPPSTLPLPFGGPPQYQQQVSSTSSGANGCSLTPPSPTASLGLPPFLGLKKKVAPSVSWAGSTPRDDAKVTRSVSFYSCRDQPIRDSVVSPGQSQSGRSSVSPNRQIGPSGEFPIPRNQLIYSDSFRSEKESLSQPKDERPKFRQLLSRSESVASRKTDTLELKEHRSSVRSVQKTSDAKSDPKLKVEQPQDQRLSESPQRQRFSEPPQKQRPSESPQKQRPSESPQKQRPSEPLQKQRPSDLQLPKQRPSDLQLPKQKCEPPPKLILSEPGQELANFAYYTGSPESAGLEGSFSFSDSRVRTSASLTRGGSVKKTRGLTPSSPSPQPPPSPSKMAGGEQSLKDLTHPSLNETLKCHNAVTFKLIKTVSDFSAQLSHLHERHAEDLQHLVENFRKKHSDLRNEKAPCASLMFQAWESLLQEVEVDSQLHSDVAGTLIRQVSRPLIEKTFHRKIQSRKLFTHRESIETILAKTEEMLKKCRKDHMEAYQLHCRKQDNTSLAAYFDAHNAYVQQLYATNAMLHFYNTNALPGLLQELEEVYLDVGNVFIESILQGSEILSVKAQEQNKRYDTLALTCRTSDPHTDISCLVKYFDTPNLQQKGIPQHRFILPQPPAPPEVEGEEPLVQEPPVIPPLRNELVLDRLAALSSRSRVESLKREGDNLEKQIAALQESMEALLRGQQRNLESCLYHKANELQEDISMKRFDLRVNQVHLAAVKAQKELFASKEGPNTDSRERKMSNSSTGSMKSKWMKAFKSLKTPSGGSGGPSGGATGRDIEKKNGRDPREGRGERGIEPPTTLFENAHILQEYTYKKITACDVCHQILRGHSRQGLKCRLCKTNVHFECQERLPRCAPKSRLLRRQRSTSEIESKQIDAGDDDEPELNINMLIASQPGRRMKDPPSPSTPTSATAPMLPPYKGASPVNPAGRNPV